MRVVLLLLLLGQQRKLSSRPCFLSTRNLLRNRCRLTLLRIG
jgi:hypothetical protein